MIRSTSRVLHLFVLTITPNYNKRQSLPIVPLTLSLSIGFIYIYIYIYIYITRVNQNVIIIFVALVIKIFSTSENMLMSQYFSYKYHCLISDTNLFSDDTFSINAFQDAHRKSLG